MKYNIISILLFLISFSTNKNIIRKLEEKTRGAGILLHITSLPSKYGIGTLGEEAYNFVDFLSKANQKYWQVLPLGPTSYGDSPYQAISSFAGNHYMIDLDMLINDGLLKNEDVQNINFGTDSEHIDFGQLFKERIIILKKAFSNFNLKDLKYQKFLSNNKNWLDDYSLYMALREKFNYDIWINWPNQYKNRDINALKKISRELKNIIDFHKFLQFKFDEQFRKLKAYCVKKNIKIIGDVPIYVAMDSADIWANKEIFQLDENNNPLRLSGVPPDAFSSEGQLWGNPLYDWEKMRKTGFSWFLERLRKTGEKFDVIRIDHFRGLESYWSVPGKDKTAKNGRWDKGPDFALIEEIHKKLSNLEFIAEDLGFLTPEVLNLRDRSGFPGMKILEFAFGAYDDSAYLPHKFNTNCVCYPGTHDNQVLSEWEKTINPQDRSFAERYMNLRPGSSLRWPVLELGMKSNSYLFVVQMQDYLGLGKDSRMNAPGEMNGKNWTWRIKNKKVLTEKLAIEIGFLTMLGDRI